MNTSKFALASLIALSAVSGAAFAGEVELPSPVAPTKSTLTRAQVQAEYLAARAAGDLPEVGDVSLHAVPTGFSTKSRAEVRAEYIQAVQAGEALHASERP